MEGFERQRPSRDLWLIGDDDQTQTTVAKAAECLGHTRKYDELLDVRGRVRASLADEWPSDHAVAVKKDGSAGCT